MLRAEAMAALALLSSTLGRPVSGLRILALAVTGLLLVDPLLVGSLGFLLSVGASAGILLLATPLAALLPGPRPLAEALGVTLAAQVGVAPVLVPVFDGLPVASLPANLLAVPVAGPLMMWGMAAGLPAGIVGGTVGPAGPRAHRDHGGVGGGRRPVGRRRCRWAGPACPTCSLLARGGRRRLRGPPAGLAAQPSGAWRRRRSSSCWRPAVAARWPPARRRPARWWRAPTCGATAAPRCSSSTAPPPRRAGCSRPCTPSTSAGSTWW